MIISFHLSKKDKRTNIKLVANISHNWEVMRANKDETGDLYYIARFFTDNVSNSVLYNTRSKIFSINTTAFQCKNFADADKLFCMFLKANNSDVYPLYKK